MRHGIGGREDLAGFERGIEDDVARFVTAAVKEDTEALKKDWREQVLSAGLGPKLANSIRSRVYPEGQKSADAGGYVWTRAPNIIDAYDRGATIVPVNGRRYLAIPTDAVMRLVKTAPNRRERVTPQLFKKSTGLDLRMVSRPGKHSLLVVDGGRVNTKGKVVANRGRSRKGGQFSRITNRVTVVAFTLVPLVKMQKRLDLDALASAAAARYPETLSKHWK